MGLFSFVKNKVKEDKKQKLTKTIGVAQLWDEYLTQKSSLHYSLGGVSIPKNMYADMIALYSMQDNITYIYNFVGYPKTMRLNYKKELRRKVSKNTRIAFFDKWIPHAIPFHSREFQARVKAANRRKMKLVGDAKNIENKTSTENRNYNESSAWLEAYEYYYDHVSNGDGKLALSSTYMLVNGKRGEDFDRDVLLLEDYLTNTLGIVFKREIGQLDTMLEQASPFKDKDFVNVDTQQKRIPMRVLTDATCSRMFTYSNATYTQGTMVVGLDIYNNMPIFKSPKNSGDSAENILIVGETGSGKSVTGKFLAFNMLAHPEIVGTINDIEGTEYLGLVDMLSYDDPKSVVVLNMGSGFGAYYDPVEIVLTGEKELDETLLEFSKEFLKMLFYTVVGEKARNDDKWIDEYITSGIDRFYYSIGVDAVDMQTWSNTKGKTIFDVYNSITTQEPKNEKSKDAFEFLLSRLGQYFSENGLQRKTLFKERITLDRIRYAKLLMCSFNMAGRSTANMDPISLGLAQLYTANISHLRSIFAKAQNKFNFKIFEELPRWFDIPGSDKILKTVLVGGRKLGDINIIITNKPSELLEGDRFGLFDSITTFFLGAIGGADIRRKLCERLNAMHVLSELDAIEENRVEEDKRKEKGALLSKGGYENVIMNKYSKAFVVGIDRKNYYVSKIHLPEDIIKSKLFFTGINVNKK